MEVVVYVCLSIQNKHIQAICLSLYRGNTHIIHPNHAKNYVNYIQIHPR